MFSQWALEVLKRGTYIFRPKIRLAFPLRFIADLLVAISIFLWFNRRPLTNYNLPFWRQFLYLAQLFKVVYTLRFLVVELVFRELRTFFCFIGPVVSKLAIVRKWQNANPCVAKVVNLSFFLLFIFLNLFLAYVIEWLGRGLWSWIRHPRGRGGNTFYLPKPLIPMRQKRRRRRRSSRYRVRSRSRSLPSASPRRRNLLSFWPRCRSGFRFVSPSSRFKESAVSEMRQTKTKHFYPDTLPKGYNMFSERTTRSGKNY